MKYQIYKDNEGFKIKKKTFFGYKTLSYGNSPFGECEIKFSSVENAEKYINEKCNK